MRIDNDSIAKYCFNKGRSVVDCEAWSLAINKLGVSYMKIEQDVENDLVEKKSIVSDLAISPSNKGFDFSVPSVSHEGFNFTTQNCTLDTTESVEVCNTNPFVFGSYNQHESPGM